jgi:stringent starvation protein B
MADGGGRDAEKRIQEILAALIKQRLRVSLERVEAALARWRAGDLGPFEAHAEVLAHVARADHLADVMGKSGRERSASLLRAALDAGLVSRDEVELLTGRNPAEIPALEELDSEPASEAASLPPKREVVNRLLGDGPILVHLDARRPGVAVPASLASDARLVLRFGYGLSPAIADLDIGDEGLSGTLSFGGVPHRCVLPWPAVYAVVSESDQRGMVWPDDVPAEAMNVPDEAAPPTSSQEQPEEPSAKTRRGRSTHLKLVE